MSCSLYMSLSGADGSSEIVSKALRSLFDKNPEAQKALHEGLTYQDLLYGCLSTTMHDFLVSLLTTMTASFDIKASDLLQRYGADIDRVSSILVKVVNGIKEVRLAGSSRLQLDVAGQSKVWCPSEFFHCGDLSLIALVHKLPQNWTYSTAFLQALWSLVCFLFPVFLF